mmetsp:Transcript_16467/g.45985  ORF Transcript_16467/g.45985 Transcript_16467/m.45985 type:complete len:230 (+) Transcript_16467:750-1439(+)
MDPVLVVMVAPTLEEAARMIAPQAVIQAAPMAAVQTIPTLIPTLTPPHKAMELPMMAIRNVAASMPTLRLTAQTAKRSTLELLRALPLVHQSACCAAVSSSCADIVVATTSVTATTTPSTRNSATSSRISLRQIFDSCQALMPWRIQVMYRRHLLRVISRSVPVPSHSDPVWVHAMPSSPSCWRLIRPIGTTSTFCHPTSPNEKISAPYRRPDSSSSQSTIPAPPCDRP